VTSRRLAPALLLALLICAGAHARTDTSKDTLEQRLRPCTTCHGEQGRPAPDGYYPRIAGKLAGYLFEQLLNFRDGRRDYAMMSYLVDRQSEAYLREMANYFAELDLPYPAPAPIAREAAVFKLGERLVREGDSSRDLPACAACHGERLTGTAPRVPALLGLQRFYMVAQLSAWRDGRRRARAPDCMAEIAQRLRPEEIDAVVSWLASQPMPSDPRPAAGTLKPPLRCGSLEPR
jgi:cytochrome c553